MHLGRVGSGFGVEVGLVECEHDCHGEWHERIGNSATRRFWAIQLQQTRTKSGSVSAVDGRLQRWSGSLATSSVIGDEEAMYIG